jgi:hypothetical protein
VFVQGLFGDRLSTWTAESRTPWPKEFLPEDFPKARIYTFGYDEQIPTTSACDEITPKTMESHAIDICKALAGVRTEANTVRERIPICSYSDYDRHLTKENHLSLTCPSYLLHTAWEALFVHRLSSNIPGY